jgi:hypothetical protein
MYTTGSGNICINHLSLLEQVQFVPLQLLIPMHLIVKKGDLVYFDFAVHDRDDPDAIMLMGLIEGMTEGSRNLMKGEWRNDPFAEYVKVPWENLCVLDQNK